MRRIAAALIVTITFALVLLYDNRDQPKTAQDRPGDETVRPAARTPQPQSRSAAQASVQAAKQRLVAQDVAATDALCRTHCALDFRRAADRSAAAGSDPAVVLQRMRSEHPHMQTVIWSRNSAALDQGVREGTVPAALGSAAQPLLAKAKSEAAAGREFQSSPLQADGDTFFVLGVPSSDRKAAVVGIIRQSLLGQVRAHQMTTLRAVPFPAGGSWKIQTIDATTKKPVIVDHPQDNAGVSHFHNQEVVVKFSRPVAAHELAAMQRDIGAVLTRKLGYTYVFQSNRMTADQLMAYFRNKSIVYAEPHFLYLSNENGDPAAAALAPNDQLYARYQWNLPIIDTELGWRLGKGSGNVIVGIVDTGIDANHPDLQGRILPGLNVVNPSGAPNDDVGHGTHVAGVIAALTNNGEGVAGMTWYNPILPVKVLDKSGSGSTYAVAQGIIWAADHGAKVINMSLGNYAEARFLHDAIRYAFNKDVVLIAASGNDNTEQPGYPAAYPEVLAVAATDVKLQKASFSNYGDYVDVAAPGVNIASTYPNNQYAALSGTSMASPHVTALAALIRSANPGLKNTEVMDIIRRSSSDLGDPGPDKMFGHGEIDVARALQLANPNADGNVPPPAGANRSDADGGFVGWLRRLFGR